MSDIFQFGRHEPPVLAGRVIVLEEGPDIIVVSKPATVPVRVIDRLFSSTRPRSHAWNASHRIDMIW